MGLNIQDLAIRSSSFDDGGRMDDRFTKEGGNDQPALEISGVPDGTVELAVICHDPDAPLPWGFTHWVLTGIPADATSIGENAGDGEHTPGPNDFGEDGYGGPMPPPGHGPHHYYFWVYALDTEVDGPVSRREFLDRYGDNIIEQNRTIGVYEN